ncbi:methyltransferase domain-containing protein [Streptomyces sp. ACA25]|uniref:methyltransferase domain-containing protein n=1 Tax=Streptomyces sp. ACA25 TaxID=3022596 RepID=UPI0023070942|nr:methyltransferase domain-containing protein [Streptomyces sp. ACA25]MDB1088768.1 methyltransferase domain-containing protein [Streptomyces sp. ACA25]
MTVRTTRWAAAFWQCEFAALPRARFLPDLMWPHDMATRTARPVDRRTDPDGWRSAADANMPVVTQWDDGRHSGTAPGTEPTSSASMPSVVAAMLAAAELKPGHRVLEIGTGTGWTAALMARRLGDQAVTSIEIDLDVAAAAKSALGAAGLHPRLLVGDGLAGHPDGAPYDRLISTMGLRDIPAAWLHQVRPGGLIVTPWGTRYSNGDVLTVLTVNDDGTATGRFLQQLEFMKARSQRYAHPAFAPDLEPVADSTCEVDPSLFERWHPFAFAAGLLLYGMTHAVQQHDSSDRTLWLFALDGSAWTAAVLPADSTTATVRQVGDRRLWDELTAAHTWWRTAGEPDLDRLGITITATGWTAWLDTPGHPVRGQA